MLLRTGRTPLNAVKTMPNPCTRLNSTPHNSQVILIINNNNLQRCAQSQYYDREPRKHETDRQKLH
jgi:hypothetical protein